VSLSSWKGYQFIQDPAIIFKADEASGVHIGVNVDKTTCIRWVGETYLEANAPSMTSAIGLRQFKNEWKDLLPESWRNDVSVTQLTVRLHQTCKVLENIVDSFILLFWIFIHINSPTPRSSLLTLFRAGGFLQISESNNDILYKQF
jgi:Sister chromatid cohesion protein Dcc1